MTHAERKLRKAGLGDKVDSGQIVIKHGKSIEICVREEDGDIDPSATGYLALDVASVLYWVGHRNG